MQQVEIFSASVRKSELSESSKNEVIGFVSAVMADTFTNELANYQIEKAVDGSEISIDEYNQIMEKVKVNLLKALLEARDMAATAHKQWKQTANSNLSPIATKQWVLAEEIVADKRSGVKLFCET